MNDQLPQPAKITGSLIDDQLESGRPEAPDTSDDYLRETLFDTGQLKVINIIEEELGLEAARFCGDLYYEINKLDLADGRS